MFHSVPIPPLGLQYSYVRDSDIAPISPWSSGVFFLQYFFSPFFRFNYFYWSIFKFTDSSVTSTVLLSAHDEFFCFRYFRYLFSGSRIYIWFFSYSFYFSDEIFLLYIHYKHVSYDCNSCCNVCLLILIPRSFIVFSLENGSHFPSSSYAKEFCITSKFCGLCFGHSGFFILLWRASLFNRHLTWLDSN